MELEMEKVYHPCVLCTKKRYVGWMYEHEKASPSFDAKGIETVRRDGCAAERKVLEKCLRLLFTSGDLSAVKAYMLRQCDKLQSGRASLVDYVIALLKGSRSRLQARAFALPRPSRARVQSMCTPRRSRTFLATRFLLRGRP